MSSLKRLQPYGIALIAVAGSVFLRSVALAPLLGERGPFSALYLAVLLAAWIGGLGPGLFATALCLAAAIVFFIPHSQIFETPQLALMGVFAATCTLISMICESMRRARRKAEAAREDLQASEERFRALADDAPILIWMSDTTGACTWLNRAWLEFTGRSLNQEIGHGWMESIHRDDRDRCLEIFDKSFLLRQPFELDYRLRRRDGEYRWVVDRGTPLFAAGGIFTGYMGGCVDIHERKEAERTSAQRLEQEQAARAEAERIALLKDEFLATVSHEMRTPLTAILGWAQLLRNGSLGPDGLSQALEIIERNARTQSQLIEDLLDMSHILSGRMRLDVQRVKLADILEAALATAEPAAAAKHIRIAREFGQHAAPVFGDPVRLQQVVWNLVNNAIKFTPDGGTITIGLRSGESRIAISVADTGEGISPEFLPHVFDRFRQADATSSRRHGGLGLGLAIVRHLVELHGGSVRAASPGLGRGSTFTIDLPVSAAHASPRGETLTGTGPERSHGEGDSPVPCLGGADVLVVDDDNDTREMLRMVLEQSGARVRVAPSAREAMAALGSRRPDVLVSDIGMPEEDGYSLIRKIRAHPEGGRLPAVALTAFARSEDRRRAISAGFQMHLSKPIEPAELVTVVASLAKR